jgi:hypothetical protein
VARNEISLEKERKESGRAAGADFLVDMLIKLIEAHQLRA